MPVPAAALDYDPFAPAVQADPYPFYASLRRDAPVAYVDALSAFAVSRYGDEVRDGTYPDAAHSF